MSDKKYGGHTLAELEWMEKEATSEWYNAPADSCLVLYYDESRICRKVCVAESAKGANLLVAARNALQDLVQEVRRLRKGSEAHASILADTVKGSNEGIALIRARAEKAEELIRNTQRAWCKDSHLPLDVAVGEIVERAEKAEEKIVGLTGLIDKLLEQAKTSASKLTAAESAWEKLAKEVKALPLVESQYEAMHDSQKHHIERAEKAEAERDAAQARVRELEERLEAVRRRMKRSVSIYLPDSSIDNLIDYGTVDPESEADNE